MNDKGLQKCRDWTLPWETPMGWICMLGYLAIVLAGIWSPDDLQGRWPAVKSFAEFMAAWNPQIAFVGNMQITGAKTNQFLYAVLWCVMPIFWAMLVRQTYRKLKPDNFVFTFKSVGELIALLFGLSLLLLLVFHPQGDADGRLGQLLFGYRITRSLFAPWIVFSAGFLLISILSFAVAWLSGRVRYENEGKKV